MIVCRLNPDAVVPKQAIEDSAGYDLSSCEELVIPFKGRSLVDTGLSISIPEGHYGRIAPRSGLAVKYGIDVGAGVIDVGYTGPVKVLLFNHSHSDFVIEKGFRIAQLLIIPISHPEIIVVESIDQVAKTARGYSGFGSSGH